jgi:hypothetical protein
LVAVKVVHGAVTSQQAVVLVEVLLTKTQQHLGRNLDLLQVDSVTPVGQTTDSAPVGLTQHQVAVAQALQGKEL